MRTLYFDCFSGVSGDMLLGALVDLGLDVERLAEALAPLGLEGYRIAASRVTRSSLAATKVDVVVGDKVESLHGEVVDYAGPEPTETAARDHDHDHDHGHGHSHPHDDEHAHAHAHRPHGEGERGRGLGEILDLIRASGLSDRTKARASLAFNRLGEAEAKMHGTTPDQVHFHEVGALDAIVDIVGAFVAFELLGVERFVCSPLNVGSGTVTFSHGTYPVPAPATAELLRGAPVYAGEVARELVTPTGAAVVTTVADAYGRMPEMRIDRVGYGAGGRDVPGHPNVLRLLLGEAEGTSTPGGSDRVAVIEAAIDDMTAEALGYFVERALGEGALDVLMTPTFMKKGRPGVQLTVLAAAADLERMVRLVFLETTTIGLRHREMSRRVLEREQVTVETAVGPIRVKVARLDGEVVTAAPEYEDCREAAGRSGLSLRRVQSLASAAWAKEGEHQ